MTRRPNFLILMVDQMTGTLCPDGPAGFLKTPHLASLAEGALRFSNCYTPSPLCLPSRASFMSGMLPSRSGVYDNAAEVSAALPTFAHYLRRAGYRTVLSGKMHFVGPDQLHGFEERLTTDIYPADFGWTPDYRKPGERIDWWYHNLGVVSGAGVAEISNQLEFDDEVAFHAEAELYRLARGAEAQPWCLTVSFTHPHDPYVARQEYWDLYDDCPALLPEVAAIPYEAQDPHSQRLMEAVDFRSYDITEAQVRRARRAYFANISYLDEKIGRLLAILRRCRLEEDTVVIFCSDHGDMLGERGLWFKMSFFEDSARIPMMMRGPGLGEGRVATPVSTLDLLPTLTELAGIALENDAGALDGESMLPLAAGNPRRAPVLMEYAGEGSCAPLVSIRDARFKFNHCELDPPQLFDLESDPQELTNLAEDPAQAGRVEASMAAVRERWDLARFDAEVRQSQARRWLVYDALRQGRFLPWDHQPELPAAERYMRNHMDLNVVEEKARFPR
ncbi:choline-sulfatase [Pelagibius marinus]|uniref:choline-sulfatase n=1 Tax=Pelagibius marinus TaxID=2762760 RepID=UPI0018731268|nr:choline-sulfatase [Pelagibius marinus]